MVMRVKLVDANGDIARFTPHASMPFSRKTDGILGRFRAGRIWRDDFANSGPESEIPSIVAYELNIGVRGCIFCRSIYVCPILWIIR